MTPLRAALCACEVVVPFRPNGCSYREAAWAFCRERYQYPVTVAAGGEPWSKGAAVMPAVAASEADIIVLADADVVCDGLSEAVQAVADGAAWARPHNSVVRLSEEGTRAYMNGACWTSHPLDRLPYGGIDGGGILVAPRKTLLEIPMDPRFNGWGNEDWAHGFAFYARKGPVRRGNYPLIHLWHPLEPRDVGRKHGSLENQALWQRYKNARSNPAEMDQLLKEARVALSFDEPRLHDRPKDPVGSGRRTRQRR